VESFRGFDYVALGHLHAPQVVSAGVRYSGSLLKYSFAEAEQSKAVLLAEVDRDGPARIEHVPLGQKRDVARLRGTLAELLSQPELERHRADLLEVTLDDEGYVLDARNRLQQRFPHVLNVLRRQLQPGGEGAFAARVGRAGGDDLALFTAFMETVSGSPPTPEELACFASTAFEVARKGGEA